jgi:hypothetical protein
VNEPRFDHAEPSLWRPLFRVSFEPSAIGPVNPWFPDLCHETSKSCARASVFEATYDAAWLHHSTKLSHSSNLQFIGQNAEQERRYGGIEISVGKVQTSYVHLPQFDRRRSCMKPSFRARKHGRTKIDANHLRSRWVKRKIATGADTGVENSAREAAKYLRPDAAISTVFERQIEQIIDPGYALVSIKI